MPHLNGILGKTHWAIYHRAVSKVTNVYSLNAYLRMLNSHATRSDCGLIPLSAAT